MVHQIKKGLDLPVSGQPVQSIHPGSPVSSVALLGDDYVGMKPTMLVAEGDRVKVGQPLFEDKKTPGVLHTSPGCGTVKAVNRGEKRKFESIEIELDGDEQVSFDKYDSPGAASQIRSSSLRSTPAHCQQTLR
jgi:Na+-transporting NADH:ubiquinone oxidoreductase subunit A